MSNKLKAMDCRCPLKLKESPTTFCPLAVQRLKAIRHSGKELTEEEENKLPGCPYAVRQQLANYCFFNLADFMPDTGGFSEVEVAHLLNLSVDSVKKIEKKAIQKLREYESLKEIASSYVGEQIVDDGPCGMDADFPSDC